MIYNIQSILNQTFGIRPIAAAPGLKSAELPDVNKVGAKAPVNPEIRKSVLGIPVYESLEVEDLNGNSYTFPDNTVVDVSLPIVIEKTAIQGRKTGGTVKEFISEDDWRVTIYGVIVNPVSRDYPLDAVTDFLNAIKKGEELKIAGMYLNQKGITRIVVNDISMPRKSGFPGAQPFSVTALSDEPIELELFD